MENRRRRERKKSTKWNNKQYTVRSRDTTEMKALSIVIDTKAFDQQQ